MARSLGALVLAVLAGCHPVAAVPSRPDSGGGATDAAGATDATDAAPIGGATCATPGMLFCEDFESTPLGPAASTKWTTDIQSGSLTIDATHAQGTRALHAHADGGGRALIRVAGFAPPGNSFYGRMRIWVTEFPTVPDNAHFTIVEVSGNAGGVVRPIGGQYIPTSSDPAAGKSLWGVGSDGGATGDWTRWKTAAPAEAGRWLCMEWQLRASDDAVNVWINGSPRPELAVSKTDHDGNRVDFVFPTFTQIWFGWWLYQSGTTPASFDVWYDDIALGTSQLGC